MIVHPQVLAYIVDVVRATRMSPSLQLGRLAAWRDARIMRTARAWAWLSGRDYVSPDDVKALAFPTLRHRVSLRPEAELEGRDHRLGDRVDPGHRPGAPLTTRGS